MAPKRQRGRERVQGLLDAAAAVFAEKGYDAATMTEVAARAGAAIGSLYRFFPAKEALGDALLARYAERMEAGLDALALRVRADGVAALADGVVALVLGLRTDRAAAIALVDASPGATDRRAGLRAGVRRRLALMLLDAGTVAGPEDAAARAAVLLHLMKALPALAEEEEATGASGLVEAARRTIALAAGGRL